MTTSKTVRLTTLLCTILTVPAAWSHPGHAHNPDWTAALVHSLSSLAPLLIAFLLAWGFYSRLKRKEPKQNR